MRTSKYVLMSLITLVLSNTAIARLPIQTWKSAHGATVLFIETHQLPMLDVALVYDAGARRDPADKQGLAAQTVNLLNKGAIRLGCTQVSTTVIKITNICKKT